MDTSHFASEFSVFRPAHHHSNPHRPNRSRTGQHFRRLGLAWLCLGPFFWLKLRTFSVRNGRGVNSCYLDCAASSSHQRSRSCLRPALGSRYLLTRHTPKSVKTLEVESPPAALNTNTWAELRRPSYIRSSDRITGLQTLRSLRRGPIAHYGHTQNFATGLNVRLSTATCFQLRITISCHDGWAQAAACCLPRASCEPKGKTSGVLSRLVACLLLVHMTTALL